jgi:hypothetical protein
VYGGPTRIPLWVIPPDETKKLFEDGHGTTLDPIYARGIPTTPNPDLTNVNKMQCTFILVEVEFCKDLGCDTKLTEKTEKYPPLVAALKKFLGKVEFIANPIGHAGTTLQRTLEHLATALSTVRPHGEQGRASTGVTDPDTDSNAKSHDYRMFKSLLASLIYITHSRLLGIVRNRMRLIEALPKAMGHRAQSVAAPTHTHATLQSWVATHIHRTRCPR